MLKRSINKKIDMLYPITDNIINEYYYDYFNKLYLLLLNISLIKSNTINDIIKKLKKNAKINHKVNITNWAYKKIINSNNYLYLNNYIIYSGLNNKPISNGTWSGKPIVNFYRCYRYDLDISTYRFGTNITVKTHTGFNYNPKINLIKQYINEPSKKIICISLLSPCNLNICKVAKNISSLNTKLSIALQEKDILNKELMFSQHNNDIIFITLPLSYPKKGILNVFDYNKFKNDVKTINKNTDIEEITNNFYDIIDISGSRETFKSIVDLTVLYYNKYKDKYHLAYHCKSGLDRSGIFDAIVQATLTNIKENPTNLFDYKKIRNYTKFFLIYGYIIGYYARSFFGLKLESNKPLFNYVLGRKLYNFYFGNAGYAGSSK